MKSNRMKMHGVGIAVIATLCGLVTSNGVSASSHREAPAIAEDPTADNTDVYAFISPNDSNKLVVIANYMPLLFPSSGPNFWRWSDDVRYEILLDNDGDAVPDITYRWEFTTHVRNDSTFLYNVGPVASIDDPNLNVRQTYTLWKIEGRRRTVVAENVPAAPWHVGRRSFPGYQYDMVAAQAIREANGVKMFAGPRDEGFYLDLDVFDLLGVGDTPSTDNFNVMSLVLELPIASVADGGERPAAEDDTETSVVGVYARALRRRIEILGRRSDSRDFGPYVQVSRLGWPLVNEVLIALKDKDKYNRTDPANDVQNFGAYILDPEPARLLNLVYMAGCPDPGDGRLDIVGLLSPNGTMPADLLRINISEGQTYEHSHFPNGRQLSDDVLDTAVTVTCNNGMPLGDMVPANDKPFLAEFPYLPSPHSGNL